MQYFAQREHALRLLNLLLSNLYAISYLIFPSLTLFFIRWLIQYVWLALQKEFIRYQLRWTYIPLLLLVISLWIHSTTQPGTAIILDFIGRAPISVTGVMFFDFTIAFLELVGTAIYYEHAIIFSRYHHNKHTTKDKTAVRTRRNSLILDLTWSRFIALLWNPKVLYKDPRNINGSATNTTPGQGEGEEDSMLGQNPTMLNPSRLPLPFNLDFSRPTRASRTGNTVPGALLRDW
ncbi:hypothetical protein CPB86DRAFT_761525 [Serendipita vermifera]|nr:hypothetical protein CPB86DRAFT_761525 [Serendipita vermifera]